MNAGHRKDGINFINPTMVPGRHFPAFCKFELASGKAWIVIQRRISGEVDFNRTWLEYENGFGLFHGSFWLGLWKMHDLTYRRGKTARLRIDLKSNIGRTREKFAEYGAFAVNSSTDKYKLHLRYHDNYASTVGDSFAFRLNGMAFTTFDKDNDVREGSSCPIVHSGGWWYRNCFPANLNGIYPLPSHLISNCRDWANNSKYMTWESFNYCYGDITYSEMRISVG